MYITNGSVRGDPEHFDILFLDNLNISEQTIDRTLTIHTELYNYQLLFFFSFDFYHIPKLSMGFNSQTVLSVYAYQIEVKH